MSSSYCRRVMPAWAAVLVVLSGLALPVSTFADENLEKRVKELESLVHGLVDRLATKDQEIEKLNTIVQDLQREHAASATATATVAEQSLLDRMSANLTGAGTAPSAAEATGSTGTPQVRLTDLSAVLNAAVGVSSQRDEALENLQGGGHDPKRRGFSFQQLELSLAGVVDPWFDLESHILFSEAGVELEEAFATTRALPADLQLKVGYFLTEFGRINAQHPHSWDWLDQPLINSRIFGGDGMRGAGARLSWLAPLPWYSELIMSVQNADGAYMASFSGQGLSHAHGDEHEEEEHGEATIGGRPIVDRDVRSHEDMVFMLRLANGFDIGDSLSGVFGVSGIAGPNNTGNDGYTRILGTDLTLKYSPPGRGLDRPMLTWQTEIIRREFHADDVEILDDLNLPVTLPSDRLDDWGLYSQLLHTLNRDWSWGIRYEYASGNGDSYEHDEIVDPSDDPFRDTRWRVSPLLVYHPSEFARLRLQYNYDDASHLADAHAHSLWLGFEFLIGSHPAHRY